MLNTNKIIKTVSVMIAGSALLYASKNMFLSRAEDQKLTIQMTIPAVDFDESMQQKRYKQILENPTMEKLYTTFKEQYIRFHPDYINAESATHIPKKIHQIWLGNNNKLPKEYEQFQKSWQRFHPEWEYKLWTEKDIATFPFKNRDLFDAASNYGEKSDIWRYEILHIEGGFYADTDFQCLAPFDAFCSYDFVIGIQPMDTNIVQLGIGLIGSCPGHPLLRMAINYLRKTQNIKQIVSKTGPIFFTRIFYNAASKTGMRDIALPPTYFYPCGYNQRGLAPSHWLKPESFAVHHWAGSWLKKEAFEKK